MTKNLSSLAKRIQNLTEEEIKKVFDEIMDYNRKGTLPLDALVRNIRDEYAKELNNQYWDMPCLFTANEITFEIAKRHYGIKEK